MDGRIGSRISHYEAPGRVFVDVMTPGTPSVPRGHPQSITVTVLTLFGSSVISVRSDRHGDPRGHSTSTDSRKDWQREGSHGGEEGRGLRRRLGTPSTTEGQEC